MSNQLYLCDRCFDIKCTMEMADDKLVPRKYCNMFPGKECSWKLEKIHKDELHG